MYSIRKVKDEIRREYSEKRASIPIEERKLRDMKICDTAKSLVSFRYAEIVLMYAPIGNEIDIMPIAEEALARGKKLAFPRCITDKHIMNYHYVTNLDELSVQSYNIREPREDAPMYNPETDTGSVICFVPGIVFDREGYRLGYGKGYYDRYLANFKGSAIGITYSDFIVDSVPRGRFDLSLGILLTEKGAVVI